MFDWLWPAKEKNPPPGGQSYDQPEVGKTYFFVKDGRTDNPFMTAEEQRVVATIREVKEGWVLYRIGGPGAMFDRETMPIDQFKKMYEWQIEGSN